MVGTSATAIVLLTASLTAVRRETRGSILDLSTMALATTITAPVAWEHHYGVVVPLAAAVWPAIVRVDSPGSLTHLVLFGAMLTAANYIQATHRFDGTPFSPLQSYLFGAGLVFWWLALRAQRRERYDATLS
jgi:alpha-1,2-mannosyltransferase